MRRLYGTSPYIRSAAIINSEGIIQTTFPEDPMAVGADVSYNPESMTEISEGRPILSTAFESVEGIPGSDNICTSVDWNKRICS
ncbi:hypothetical protein [Methanocalculus sp.]|uniref:hypothetical protein n=1 Tax=Methanocalculus sp. TaxID=2004547 RepID=UPI0027195680|nr:hypothetical protein [Methanocalculus sp.]MDO8842651.1 hypothetical protein [Methanocalculus sp.]